MTLACPVREIAFGPFRRALVVPFGGALDSVAASYEGGWVLTPLPGAYRRYRKYVLPSTDQINLSAVAALTF